MNESGNFRRGCKIISKGEVYERQYFEHKQAIFKDYNWLDTIKQQYTELINENLRELSIDNILEVFNPNGPYMPTQKIGKNNPLSSDIEKNNQLCMVWNKTIDEVLATGIVNEAELSVYKYRNINEVLEAEVNASGWKSGLHEEILSGTSLVKDYQETYGIKSFEMPDKSLTEIKSKKAAKFKRLDWSQATVRKPKYVPYEQMNVYQKVEFRKMKEIERLLGKS